MAIKRKEKEKKVEEAGSVLFFLFLFIIISHQGNNSLKTQAVTEVEGIFKKEKQFWEKRKNKRTTIKKIKIDLAITFLKIKFEWEGRRQRRKKLLAENFRLQLANHKMIKPCWQSSTTAKFITSRWKCSSEHLPKRTFLKDCCCDAIRGTCLVGIQFRDVSRKHGQYNMHIT